MKLKFKFSSDVTFHVNVEYPYVDENEILSRIDKCIDNFEFTFDDYALLDIVENFLNDETWAEVSDLNCKVIKNKSEFAVGEITFNCEVEFNGNVGEYSIKEANYEDEFYQKFIWALSENGCYVDTYAIYVDGDEVEDFDLNVSWDTNTIKYSCEVTED
jgi:hypothetical protein